MNNAFISALEKVVGKDQLFTEKAQCWNYGYDYSKHHHCPDFVLFAESHEEVLQAVLLCNEYKIPVTAHGRGTGIVGGAVPLQGGLVISFERMANIIEIDPGNRIAIVEPGLINHQLQLALKEQGFFWAPDPSSNQICSIGGNIANNSAGPRAVKYGATRDNVVKLQCVTGRGETLLTGFQTSKYSVGYDLTRLIIGSEGTLALVTKAWLKILPLAKAKATLSVFYSSIEGATHAVEKIMASAITPCALEFIDKTCLNLIRTKINLPENANAMLMVEVDGIASAMSETLEQLKLVLTNKELIQIKQAESAEERQQLWLTRKTLSPTLREIAPKKINEDVVVPVANIASLINYIEQLASKHNIIIANFGHAGNGNIHVNLLIDPNNKNQSDTAYQVLEQIFNQVISLNGTISGEHGIGIDKQSFIARTMSPYQIELMKNIKKQFDPNGILNPNKIFP